MAAGLSACNGASGRSPDLASQSIDPSESPPVAPKTTVQKLNYNFGPFDLPAGASAKAMANKNNTLNFHVESPVWMTGFEPRLVDKQGNPLPSDLVQLVVLSNGSEANPLCTSRQAARPFAAATSMLKEITLPEGHGYPLLPEDKLEAKIVLRNPSKLDYDDVYFAFTITAEPMDVASHKLDVAPLLLDVDPCDNTPISLPPNGLVEKEGSFTVPESGAIVKAQGLLQTYGVSVSVETNKATAPFKWSAKSQLNDDHQIVHLDDYENSPGTAVEKDEPITLGVVYDNFSNKWFNDATAAAIIYLARDAQSPATTLRPSSDGHRTSNQPNITATKAQSLLMQ